MKNNLKKILDDKRMTTRALSIATSIHEQTLGKYVREQDTPSLTYLLRVAQELQVAPVDILPDLGKVTPHPDTHDWQPHTADYSKCSRCHILYPTNVGRQPPARGCEGE